MKRLLTLVILAMVISAVVAVGVANANHGTDYAKGTVDQFDTSWTFDARSSAFGTDPQGRIRLTLTSQDPNTVVTAKVTCLRVQNGLFEARGVITDVNGGGFFGTGLLIRGSDTGKFSPNPDTFQGQQLFTADPNDPGPCSAPSPGFPVDDGQVVVHDS